MEENSVSEIVRIIGQRIRYYRNKRNYTQEKLSEISGLHATYIGQVERGEKNVTLESLKRITSALDISLSQLFEGLPVDISEDSIPLKSYQLFLEKSLEEQEHLYKILKEIDRK